MVLESAAVVVVVSEKAGTTYVLWRNEKPPLKLKEHRNYY